MEKAGATYIHLDVMDGKFVPATTFDHTLVEKISHIHGMVNDVHLMVENPAPACIDFARAGADIITVHYEAFPNVGEVHDCIALIHSLGKKAGLSIKPATKMEVLEGFWKEIDLCLIMSVEPGKGGQAYLDGSNEKLEYCKKLNEKQKGHHVLIEVDGGINASTAPIAVSHGAELLVAGSYLYGHKDFAERLEGLLKL